jgi:hypothetical protein
MQFDFNSRRINLYWKHVVKGVLGKEVASTKAMGKGQEHQL